MTPLGPTATRVGDVSLVWGESLRWDDRRQRLSFVDCATRTLHWIEGTDPAVGSLPMPGLPTGVALAEDGRLVVALDDGFHVVDIDAATVELLVPYPPELGGRANDANADLDGGIVTGTLNLAPAPGSIWRYSTRHGWRQLDDGIANTNGPVVVAGDDGSQVLVVADTLASTLIAYRYDGDRGSVSERRVLVSTEALGGSPDGACVDASGAVWSCLLGAGKLLRVGLDGGHELFDTFGVEQPSDVTFGGPGLDRLFLVSITVPIGAAEVTSPDAGALLAIDGTGIRGRVEPRVRL